MKSIWIGCDFDGSYTLFESKPSFTVNCEFKPAPGDKCVPLRGRLFNDFLLNLRPGFLAEISVTVTNPRVLL